MWNMSDGSSDLRSLQQCCCRVVVLPGLDPPGTAERAPPRSPAEEMEINDSATLIQQKCLLTNEENETKTEQIKQEAQNANIIAEIIP